MRLGIIESFLFEAQIKQTQTFSDFKLLVLKNPRVLSYKGENPRAKVFLKYALRDTEFLELVQLFTGYRHR